MATLTNKTITHKLELAILCMISISNRTNFHSKNNLGGGGWKEVLNKENNSPKIFYLCSCFIFQLVAVREKKITRSFFIKEVKTSVFTPPEIVNEYFVRTTHKSTLK